MRVPQKNSRFIVVPLVFALGATLLAAGCGSGGSNAPAQTATVLPVASPSPSDGPVSATGRYQDLVFSVTAPKRVYARGETIPLTMTVQNTGSTNHALG